MLVVKDGITLPLRIVTDADMEAGKEIKLPEDVQPDNLQDIGAWWVKLFTWFGGAIACRERQLADALRYSGEQSKELERINGFCREFVWGEDNPQEYESEMTRLRNEVARLNDKQAPHRTQK